MEWELASKSVLLEYLPSGPAQPGPASGRLALMLFANLFGLCRLFRFIVYKLQTDCFKKLASFNQISQAPSAADEGVLDGGNILCR